MAMTMTQKPLVSNIVIFLNASPFFEETIASIFAQTYENWELLLVDDGSTDGSTEIALKYAQKYPEKVRYLEHESHQNRGMSATRNLGIRHAQGEYIAFLDADDLWLPNTLADQVMILEAHPDAAMVYGPIEWWYSWSGKPQDLNADFVENPGVPTDTLIQPPILFILLLQRTIAISGMLIRRKIIEQVNGFEDQFKTLYEDQAFCVKVCLQFPVFAASHCWYKYRRHPNSCTIATKAKQEFAMRLAFLKWLEKYLLETGMKDSLSWQTLKRELFLYKYPFLLQLLRLRHFMFLLTLSVGRSILPKNLRHWLWVTGIKLKLINGFNQETDGEVYGSISNE
jgi:glycosyltransferase involved in cell wall biosynthesis